MIGSADVSLGILVVSNIATILGQGTGSFSGVWLAAVAIAAEAAAPSSCSGTNIDIAYSVMRRLPRISILYEAQD